MKYIILLSTLIFSNCRWLIPVVEIAPLGNMPAVEMEGDALIYLHDYMDSSIQVFDPVDGEVKATYTFPDRIVWQVLPHPRNQGVYVSLTPSGSEVEMIYIEAASGELTYIQGIKYYHHFFGYDLSNDQVYISGQDEKNGDYLMRSLDMPGNVLGDPVYLPNHWGQRFTFISQDDGSPVISLMAGRGSQLYYPELELSVNVVNDYLQSDDMVSAIFWIEENLLNVNFLYSNETDNELYKLYRINQYDPLDMTLLYTLPDPFNHFFQVDEYSYVFSNGLDQYIIIKKLDAEGNIIAGPIHLEGYLNQTVGHYGDSFYMLSVYEDRILEISLDLTSREILF